APLCPNVGRCCSAAEGSLGANVFRRASGGQWGNLSICGSPAPDLQDSAAELVQFSRSEPVPESGEESDGYSSTDQVQSDWFRWWAYATACCSRKAGTGAWGTRRSHRRFLVARWKDSHSQQRCACPLSG